jgi:hypothetical protein
MPPKDVVKLSAKKSKQQEGKATAKRGQNGLAGGSDTSCDVVRGAAGSVTVLFRRQRGQRASSASPSKEASQRRQYKLTR